MIYPTMTGDPLKMFSELVHRKMSTQTASLVPSSDTPTGVLPLVSVTLTGVLVQVLSEAPPGGLRIRASETPGVVPQLIGIGRASVLLHAQLVLLLLRAGLHLQPVAPVASDPLTGLVHEIGPHHLPLALLASELQRRLVSERAEYNPSALTNKNLHLKYRENNKLPRKIPL